MINLTNIEFNELVDSVNSKLSGGFFRRELVARVLREAIAELNGKEIGRLNKGDDR